VAAALGTVPIARAAAVVEAPSLYPRGQDAVYHHVAAALRALDDPAGEFPYAPARRGGNAVAYQRFAGGVHPFAGYTGVWHGNSYPLLLGPLYILAPSPVGALPVRP
jgi:hypothetical protein